eukprot:Blabericola_migrator_1__310@NODE_107_length_14077_cov_92_419629_g95_i0_p5_GENE_NODE_107_length_14077_cov_92_419629_g95_i0NODE_107_length_14077_cov_92_419629_g95_i0_p5_ORF_typecomplete_len393_score14_74Lipase_3/PF01764_25/1_6e09DUF676/PF05057_14/0_24_NODE_107_length_14077_cov_92_419629_g95_i026733851
MDRGVRRVADVRRPASPHEVVLDRRAPSSLLGDSSLRSIHEGSSAEGSVIKESTSPMTHRIKHTTKCSPDLKLLCRLIGLHSRKDVEVGHEVRLTINGEACLLTVAAIVNIGCNVRCIVLEETISQWSRRCLQHLIALDPEAGGIDWKEPGGVHTLFAFNWFSPKSISDYISLGLQMCSNGDLDSGKHLLGKVYLEKAEDFLWSPEIIKYIDTVSHGLETTHRLLTLTGFSLGGAIAHAFAYLLRDVRRLSLPIRVAGFGCPRIGSPKFNKWFLDNVTADSLNLILYDEYITDSTMQIDYDPVCQRPPLMNGFTFHPNCYMLHRQFGSVRPLSQDERNFLSQQTEEKVRQSPLMALMQSVIGDGADKDRRWKKLHGLVKYYEAMHGLGGDEP